jgi:hypothetical protein
MVLGRGPRLHITLGHTMLRPIAMNATAGSLDETERALILQLVKRCDWRIRESNGAVALLDIKPTTLDSPIKKLGLVPGGDSEFSEALRILGEFKSIERAVFRVRSSLPHCSIGHFILDVRYLPRWPASCEVKQEACPGPAGGDPKMNIGRHLNENCGPFATYGEQS